MFIKLTDAHQTECYINVENIREVQFYITGEDTCLIDGVLLSGTPELIDRLKVYISSNLLE